MFDYIFPQNKETLNYLKYFKVKKIKILGNLKFSETEKKKKINLLKKNFLKKEKFYVQQVHIIMKKK